MPRRPLLREQVLQMLPAESEGGISAQAIAAHLHAHLNSVRRILYALQREKLAGHSNQRGVAESYLWFRPTGQPATVPEHTRRRMARLLGLLGSDHEGEVIAAAKAAEQLRRRRGMTWQQLLGIGRSSR